MIVVVYEISYQWVSGMPVKGNANAKQKEDKRGKYLRSADCCVSLRDGTTALYDLCRCGSVVSVEG
jgi:hypothetical protein